MKRLLVVIVLLFCIKSNAQDSIYFRNNWSAAVNIKSVSKTEIKYKLVLDTVKEYTVTKDFVDRIKYQNGTIDRFEKTTSGDSEYTFQPVDYDSLPVIKNSLRYYATDIIYNKLSFGYERMLNKKYSLDVDAFYKIAFYGNDETYKWRKAILHRSEGVEIKAGISRHFYDFEKRFSLGFSLAYRHQIFMDQKFISYPYDRIIDNGIYRVTQRKKGVGAFLKFNYQLDCYKSGFEFFVIAGMYGVNTKNKYLFYSPYDEYGEGATTNTDQIPKFKTEFMKDGLKFFPYFNFGFSFAIKQPPKGWYKQITKERDSLNYKKKSILFYNPVELLDGSLGFTYFRIFYKQAISVSGSATAPLPHKKAAFSDAILTERNTVYALNKKVTDLSLGANYNFDIAQQSFPFVGVLLRTAQFNGDYTGQVFVLNKYYAYLNMGYVARSEKGLSFAANFALGHYNNDYVANNPKWAMIEDGFIQPKNRTINSFMLSVLFGLSF